MIILKLRKGTHAFIGNMPIEFLAEGGTEVGVQADSINHVAEMLSAAGQKAFGEHLGELAHREILTESKDGELFEVGYDVTYGAGGARIATEVGRRPAKPVEPEPVPVGNVVVAPPPAVDPLATRAAQFQERTEFAPAVGRFPDESPVVAEAVAPEAKAETPAEETDPDDLPEDFPHRTELEANDITKYSQLEGKTIEELSGPEVKAQDIVDTLKARNQ